MMENAAYALVQVLHNFGAVAVVGGAFCALARPCHEPGCRYVLAWIVLLGWLVQALSGAGFGAVSLYFYGRPPDIHAYAMTALIIKIICAVLGVLLAALYLYPATRDKAVVRGVVWPALAGLGVIALSAAAILRWFA